MVPVLMQRPHENFDSKYPAVQPQLPGKLTEEFGEAVSLPGTQGTHLPITKNSVF